VAGSQVIAHIVPRDPSTFDVDQYITECRRNLPAYMVPAEIRVHTLLPRTVSGKFDRQGLSA
jgi:acyl-CoA synthetase (AMP-forming)/AMP-acid ligase II